MLDELHLERLSYDVIGSFYEVCKRLRPGYLESVYIGAMCVELRHRGVPFEREWPLTVRYRDEVVGAYRADLFVAKSIIVEVKAGRHLDESARWQTLNYLQATGVSLGLVLFFGRDRTVRRVVATETWRRSSELRATRSIPRSSA